MIEFIFLFSSLSSAGANPVVKIEVDENKDQFRVLVISQKKLSFDAYQLESPGSGFPPASVGVLVQGGNGETIGCGESDDPNFPVFLSSSSRSVKDKKMVVVTSRHPYVTAWFPSQSLFPFFDECVSKKKHPGQIGRYQKYRIEIELESSLGKLKSETRWLDFDDFKTSSWGY